MPSNDTKREWQRQNTQLKVRMLNAVNEYLKQHDVGKALVDVAFDTDDVMGKETIDVPTG